MDGDDWTQGGGPVNDPLSKINLFYYNIFCKMKNLIKWFFFNVWDNWAHDHHKEGGQKVHREAGLRI